MPGVRNKSRHGKLNRSMSASNRQPGLLNCGERLYQKGIKRKEERDRQIKKQVSEQENKDRFSFQPQINPVSRLLVNPQRQRAEHALEQYQRAKAEKIEVLRQEHHQQELQECKFTPQLSKKSQQMAHNQPPQNKFASLYRDARRRKDRQD